VAPIVAPYIKPPMKSVEDIIKSSMVLMSLLTLMLKACCSTMLCFDCRSTAVLAQFWSSKMKLVFGQPLRSALESFTTPFLAISRNIALQIVHTGCAGASKPYNGVYLHRLSFLLQLKHSIYTTTLNKFRHTYLDFPTSSHHRRTPISQLYHFTYITCDHVFLHSFWATHLRLFSKAHRQQR
jgi:hypothetical protein